MRHRATTRLLSVAALALATPLAAAAQFVPTQLTFFGDSFTDSGNGDILSFPLDLTPSPPYATGFISNGPNWAAYFAQALGRAQDAAPSLAPAPFTGRNNAVGTARTGLFGSFGPTVPIGMASQVGQYITAGNATDPNGLVVLFGGALDIFDAATLGTSQARTTALTTSALNVASELVGLYGTGARNFLVPSIPNVGLTPQGLGMGAPASMLLGQLTMEYNFLLGAALASTPVQMLAPGANILGLRLDNLFANILADAATGGTRYGLTNTTIPCFTPMAPSCATSVFVDPLHPTTAAHQLIANAAFDRVVNGRDVALAAVPEPSTILLVAGGLLALGGVMRRRRAA